MRRFRFLFVITVWCISAVKSARILAIFPSPGYSQYFVGEPLLIHLAEKGHDVTLISFYKPKKPVENIRPIEVEGLVPFSEEMDLGELNQNVFATIGSIYESYGEMTTDKVLEDKKVQQLINSNTTFDVVLLEHFANEPLMAFASHFKAPLVIFSTIGPSEWVNYLVANPYPFSYVPHTFTKFSTSMTLWERVQNFLYHTYTLHIKNNDLLPKYDKTVKKYFPNPPPIKDIIHNVSLILLNSHPSPTPPYPRTANMIEIGGFHIKPEPLPDDLRNILDTSAEGVIYFSMGTNVDFAMLGTEKVKDVLDTLAQLKQKVLWKSKDEAMQGKPSNVEIRKWMPQRAILGHKNVKAFISHCGLISTLESVYFGVPLICIPIFADQAMNAAILKENGILVTVTPQQLTKNTLQAALDEILSNKTYSENVKLRSRYFRDTPIDPMDLATYWIEFVVRHKGAPHLRCPGLKLRWYEYLFLDVIVLCLGGIVLLYATIRYIKRVVNKRKLKVKTQ